MVRAEKPSDAPRRRDKIEVAASRQCPTAFQIIGAPLPERLRAYRQPTSGTYPARVVCASAAIASVLLGGKGFPEGETPVLPSAPERECLKAA